MAVFWYSELCSLEDPGRRVRDGCCVLHSGYVSGSEHTGKSISLYRNTQPKISESSLLYVNK
jgi:hypothetical protein